MGPTKHSVHLVFIYMFILFGTDREQLETGHYLEQGGLVQIRGITDLYAGRGVGHMNLCIKMIFFLLR